MKLDGPCGKKKRNDASAVHLLDCRALECVAACLLLQPAHQSRCSHNLRHVPTNEIELISRVLHADV